MESVLLQTTVATLIAWAGGALGVGLGRLAARRLTALVYVAAGALLLVTLVDVLPDAKANLSWPLFGAAVISGIALFWLVSRSVHPICPACSTSVFESGTQNSLRKDAVLLMVALAIHSTVDGLAVAVGDGAGAPGHINLPLIAAVSLHKLPEGLALALLLVSAGYPRRAALGWTWAVESTTELGGLIGILALRDASAMWLSLIFAHVGGGFLYLVGLTASAVRKHVKIPSSLLDTSPRKTL
jgi:ZIP family zinc transporter